MQAPDSTAIPVRAGLARLVIVGLSVTAACLSGCGGSGSQSDVEATAAISPPTPAFDGRTAYEAHCAACHRDGVGGAPATGNSAAWAGRSPLWMAVLAEHAKQGYLRMPAVAEGDGASDAEIEAAAEYMLSLTYPDRPASL